MKKILNICGIMLLFLMSACCEEGDYLEINPEWWRKEWKLEGKINDKTITSSQCAGTMAYWNETKDTLILGKTILISYHKEGVSIKPGQLTYGDGTYFVIRKDVDKTMILQRLEKNDLTTTATVRFLSGDSEGSYILHVNYDGKNYELKGYPKD